jgi:hypothetical protein
MQPQADAPDQVNPEQAPIEMTITPDRTFARALHRIEMRQSIRLLLATAVLAVLLIATSLGSTVAEDPWWTVFGFLGLAFGLVLLVVVVAWPFQQRRSAGGAEPVRYVFGPDAVEWATEAATVRLAWTAVREVRALRHGYLIQRTDGGTAPLVCRTTLTPEQDAQLRRYFAGLAAKSTTTGA